MYCDGLVKRDSIDEVAEATLALGEGTRLNALFPVRHETTRGRPKQAREPRDEGLQPRRGPSQPGRAALTRKL